MYNGSRVSSVAAFQAASVRVLETTYFGRV
jgi:hypothetical protein